MSLNDWRAIPGWEGLYEVSPAGEVRSLDRTITHPQGAMRVVGRELKPDASGPYLRVTLSRDGKGKRESVHVLVATAFIGPRPDGLVVRHKDGDERNNVASNLAYGTHAENMADAVAHGTKTKVRCKNGHEFTDSNTLWQRRKGRRDTKRCRICTRASNRASERRRSTSH